MSAGLAAIAVPMALEGLKMYLGGRQQKKADREEERRRKFEALVQSLSKKGMPRMGSMGQAPTRAPDAAQQTLQAMSQLSGSPQAQKAIQDLLARLFGGGAAPAVPSIPAPRGPVGL
jgi:hypothetical protein